MLFLFLFQRICDKAGIPEIPGVDKTVEVIVMEQTKIMKDL